jgi:hypothetical protein
MMIQLRNYAITLAIDKLAKFQFSPLHQQILDIVVG